MKKWIGLYLSIFFISYPLAIYAMEEPLGSRYVVAEVSPDTLTEEELSTAHIMIQPLTTQELSPEVKKTLTIQVPEYQEMMKNAYVGLMGITAPEGADYMAVGAQIVLDNIKEAQAQLNSSNKRSDKLKDASFEKHSKNAGTLKASLNEEIYRVLNIRDERDSYIQNILKNKELILENISANEVLIQRYNDIFELPNYEGNVYTAASLVPDYYHTNYVANLRVAQAVIAFDGGDADLGFELIRQELAIVKRMFASRSFLLDQMIAVSRFYNHLSVLDLLMDEPFFSPYLNDKRLVDLLSPLTREEELGLSKSIRNEFDSSIRRWSTVYAQVFVANSDIVFDFVNEDEQPLKVGHSSSGSYFIVPQLPHMQADVGGAELMYDRNATLNATYAVSNLWVDRAALPIQELSKLYVSCERQYLSDVAQNYLSTLQREWQREHGENTIMLGYAYINSFGLIAYENYFQRYYDVQAYLRLVQVKYALLRSQTPQEQMPALLNQFGQKGAHPITQQKFIWNAEKKTLSTPCLDKELKRICNGQDEMSVRVKLIG